MKYRALMAGVSLFLTAAQQAETGSFTMTQAGTTMMTERYTRAADAIDGVMLVGGGPRVTYNARLSAGAVNVMTLKVFPPGDSVTPAQTATISFAADSMVLETVRGGAPVREPRAVPRGVVPLINPSIVWMEEIILKARANGGAATSVKVPVAILSAPQQVLDVTVAFPSATQAKIQLADLEVNLVLDARGRVQSGEVPAQGITIARNK